MTKAVAAAVLLLGAAHAAPAPITLSVYADRIWKPPANPALVSHGSVVYPIWCAQNVWKPWRQWGAQPPRFQPYLKEAALVMPTCARLSGTGSPDDLPDLYRQGPDGAMLPFDTTHPLFRTLSILRAQGIKPLIDLGGTPLALCPPRAKPRLGPFEWGIDGPADSAAYAKYSAYIKALFVFLQGPGYFSKAELESWEYQLLREPDNPDVWDPAGTGAFHDPANYRAFRKLYDWTLAGMRAAGLRVNLGIGNLCVPYPGNMGKPGSWMEPLARWVMSDSASSCPGLQRPRIDPARPMKMGFTAYGGNQLGADPNDLADALTKALAAVKPYFRGGNLIMSVGEGNLALAAGNNRGDATERGAAWNAAIFKIGMDLGLHRFQQWGFSSGNHLSEFEDGRGVMSPTYNVVRMYRMLEGSTRLETTVPEKPPAAGARVNGLAARDSNGVVRLLAYHYQADLRAAGDAAVTFDVHGLRPGQRYKATHYRVDRARSNYFRRWMADLDAQRLGGKRMAGDSLDALVGYQLNGEQRKLWDGNRAAYLRQSELSKAADSAFDARATRLGDWSRRLILPPNSVSLIVLEPAG